MPPNSDDSNGIARIEEYGQVSLAVEKSFQSENGGSRAD